MTESSNEKSPTETARDDNKAAENFVDQAKAEPKMVTGRAFKRTKWEFNFLKWRLAYESIREEKISGFEIGKKHSNGKYNLEYLPGEKRLFDKFNYMHLILGIVVALLTIFSLILAL